MATKKCTKCGLVKPITEYGKMGDKRRPRCRPCHSADSAEWVKNNRAQYLAYHRKYYDDHSRSPRILLTKEQKRANKKRWAEANAVLLNASRKKWAQNNKHISMEVVRRRQANKRRATPVWADRFLMQEVYDLAMRRTKCLGIKHAVDHIVPLIHPLVCGLHCEANLQVLTWAANRKKWNKWWPGMP